MGSATQFAANKQRPRSFSPIYLLHFQDQEVFQFDPPFLRQRFRLDFDKRFKYFLHVVIAETGAPPDLRDGLVLIERHPYAPSAESWPIGAAAPAASSGEYPSW